MKKIFLTSLSITLLLIIFSVFLKITRFNIGSLSYIIYMTGFISTTISLLLGFILLATKVSKV